MKLDIELPINTDNSDVNFTDIINWKRTRGVQGEDNNSLILTMALLYMNNKKECLHTGIEGFTGSSKSFLVDQFLNYSKYGDDILFPKEIIFIMSGGSNKAIVRNADEFKGKAVFYIEEFQKIVSGGKEEQLENIKNMSENKEVVYMLPNGEKHIIPKGMSVVYCLAINNDYKKDAETTRRFLTCDTDISQNLTNEVVESKLDRGFFKEEHQFITPERLGSLKKHIIDCLMIRNRMMDFRNPFFTKSNAHLIPKPDTYIRSFVDYFSKLMEASSIFHHKKRIISGKKMIVNLQDVYNVVTIFGDQFIRDIHGLPPYAENVLQAFDYVQELSGTEAQKMKANTLNSYTTDCNTVDATASDIHRTVKEKLGIHLDYKCVRDTLNTLTDLNFVVIDTVGKKATYRRTSRKIEELNIDFKELFEHGKNNMKLKFPDLYPNWYKMNSEPLYHPLSGTKIDTLPVVRMTGNVVKIEMEQKEIIKIVSDVPKTYEQEQDKMTEDIY